MLITLVSHPPGPGAGTAGYAARLQHALTARGHVVRVVPPGAAREGAVIALERVAHADLWRAGGGWHADAMRAIGRSPWSREVLRDRRAARTAGVVVANSRLVADALARRGLRCEIVRTGVDLSRFRPSEEEGAVLFVGHGFRRKGFEAAVRVLAQLPDRPLWVAGRDGRRALHLRRARRVLGDRLVDLGPCVDVARVLPRASVVLHPTRYDPASNLVLEAMAAGVPVVSTSRDGSSELLPRALVAADPLDSGALLRCVRAALDGGRPLGRALRQVVERWPDSRNAQAVELLLGRCANG